MSERQRQSDSPEERPLFQNTDEHEQVYAPQQVPGTTLPSEEIDRGGTAGAGTGIAAHADDTYAANTTTGPADIAGAEGDQRTVPVVAVRPSLDANYPGIATPARPDADQSDGAPSRD